MGVIVPEGECVATLVFHCAGSLKDITWSFGCNKAPTDTLIECAENTYGAFTTALGGSDIGPYATANISEEWSFDAVNFMEMTSTGPLSAIWNENNVGSATHEPPPINCTLLLNKSTALGGRKYRGRAYLPPVFPGEDGINPVGVLVGFAVTNLNGWFDNAFQALAAQDIEPLLHHSDGSAGTPITGWTVGSVIATQRRRLR